VNWFRGASGHDEGWACSGEITRVTDQKKHNDGGSSMEKKWNQRETGKGKIGFEEVLNSFGLEQGLVQGE